MRIRPVGVIEIFNQLLPLRRSYQLHSPQLLRAILKKTVHHANEMIEDLTLMVFVEHVAMSVDLDDQIVFSSRTKFE